MIVALAGGVGGARLSAGLVDVVAPGGLTVVVNTADDFEHLGLAISPDLDTVMYTLAGLENPVMGWGRRDETWSFMETLARIGGDDWFQLGDRDLAVHVERTRRLVAGETLSVVTRELASALGVETRIVPMSDNRVRTRVLTDEGELSFQHYFVRRRCEPRITGIVFEGADEAVAAPAALAALASDELAAIVLCPSNPFVSVAPILAIEGMRKALQDRRVPLVAVSPIIAGRALKGPAAKMMCELGSEPSVLGIAQHYGGLLDGLVIDTADQKLAAAIENCGIAVHVTDTVMGDQDRRRLLAEETVAFAERLRTGSGRAKGRSGRA